MAVKYTIPYKSIDNQQWRIDIADNLQSFADPIVNYTIVQNFPLVEAGFFIRDLTTGEFLVSENTAMSGNVSVTQQHSYTVTANMNNAPSGANPRLRLTIYENGILIVDKSIPAPNPGASISETGVAIAGYIYDITVTGDYSATQVPTVEIGSNTDGVPTPIRGNGSAGVIAWVSDNTDDPFACYKSSTLTMNLIQQGQINISELQVAQDRDFVVRQYLNGVLKWQGFLVPDGISYPLLSQPNNITLTAICGLTMLSDIPYTHTDLPGLTGGFDYCPMNYIRDILFLNLGSYLPIRWSNFLECTAFNGADVFTGGVQWSVNGEGYLSYQSISNGSSGDDDGPGPQQTCDYILKGILQSMQCCIYLDNGRWNIRRVSDIVRVIVPYNQIAADTGIMAISTGTQNLTSQIGRSGYPFLNENALVTVKQGAKTCQTTYTANVRDNILPNGNQDLQNPLPQGGPLYWSFFSLTNPFATSSSVSLDGRNGFSTALIGDADLVWFTMFEPGDTVLGKNGLPIDTQTMIAYINFGFQFSIAGGFPQLPGGSVIDWSTNPLQIKVIFNDENIQYFLNQYGFWTTTDTSIPIIVDNLSVNDIAQIDFNAFQNIIIPVPASPPVAGSQSDIQIMFRALPGQFYYVDNIYINIDKGNDVYESTYVASKNTTTDTRTLNISSSFGGYQLSNFMSSPFNSDNECFFRDQEAYEGTLTGLTSNAIMRCMYKAMRILNTDLNTRGQAWSFDSTFMVDSMGTSIFLPLNASYDTEKCQVNGLVAIEIRNDNVTFTETYYNSNDQQLSN